MWFTYNECGKLRMYFGDGIGFQMVQSDESRSFSGSVQ